MVGISSFHHLCCSMRSSAVGAFPAAEGEKGLAFDCINLPAQQPVKIPGDVLRLSAHPVHRLILGQKIEILVRPVHKGGDEAAFADFFEGGLLFPAAVPDEAEIPADQEGVFLAQPLDFGRVEAAELARGYPR